MCFFFVDTTADEQNLSKKATVICHDEKLSLSGKRLRKGRLKFNLTKMNIIFILEEILLSTQCGITGGMAKNRSFLFA